MLSTLQSKSRQLHSLNVVGHDRTGLLASISNEFTVRSSSPSPNITLQKVLLLFSLMGILLVSFICKQLEESSICLGYALEKATKWDDGFIRSSMNVHQNHGQLKLFKDQLNTAPAIYSLLAPELQQAHYCINRLENEKEGTKKKVDHIMMKLAEEKASWQSKEHQKVRNIIEPIDYI